MRLPQIEIRRHPRCPETHALVIVTVRGRCYSCTWANESDEPPITQAQALDAWKNDRQSFALYNCMVGV